MKHAAPQPWRRRGMVTGIPLELLVAAVRPDVARLHGVRFARP
jgi:hypothetical protein